MIGNHKLGWIKIVAALLGMMLLPGAGVAETGMAMFSTAATQVAPSQHVCAVEHCYWETPMDISNVEEIWNMLMAPMIVLDGHQRETRPLYAQPDENADVIGRVTCDSQGVHLLEMMNNGWSRIECYSDVYENGKQVAWNVLMEGYVPSDQLREQEMVTRYGMVVDKLDQRLYLFEDGKLLDILQVSTGLPTDKNPDDETTSGEFILCSAVGNFVTDTGGVAQMAFRFNRGNLLHEIPYAIDTEGNKSYRRSESQLGQRASEGCIRVQRARTPQGINMRWIWNTLRKDLGTRIVIWEDVKGRAIPMPDEFARLYYAPNASMVSKFYHSSHTCYALQGKWNADLFPFIYGDLGIAHLAELEPCRYCNPPLRPEKIVEINSQYAK